jgi:NAD-dependent deacetylase
MSTERLAELIRSSKRTVALTGAGISVPSGIPDFRSPGTGLWEKVDPMEVAHISVFLQDPERFWSYYRPRFGMLSDKQPNPAHRALAELESRGMLDAVVTQNIDTLHRKAGSRRVIEVHGTIETGSCWDCKSQFPLEEVARCGCGGAVKPDVVLFGEMLPERAMEEAHALCAGAELLLCVGTSLEVFPVAGLPEVTRRAGGSLAIVTMGPTPYDAEADVRLEGDVVDELEALLAVL